jgi:hypothetical protein
MTDDPGNSSQNATIRRTQDLRAAGEVRILGCWKYFERYSEAGRVPVVRTQSTFGLRSMWGNQHHADPFGSQMFVKLAAAIARSTSGEQTSTAHHPRFHTNILPPNPLFFELSGASALNTTSRFGAALLPRVPVNSVVSKNNELIGRKENEE